MISFCRRAFGIAATITAAAGTIVLVTGTAGATVTCPTVASDGTVTPAPTPGADWAGCSLYRADLAGADLSGADLTETLLSNANLAGADLSGADLSGAHINSSWLTGANLDGADLAVAELVDTVTGGITGTPSKLPANWVLADGYLAGPGAYLYRADLAGADLAGADLTNDDMRQVDLASADLSGANLSGANMSDATLTGADLSGADLQSGTMVSTNLSKANLTSAQLSDALLDLSDLAGANLTGATLPGVHAAAITGIPAALPTHWALVSGYLIGPDADLAGASFAGLNLSGRDLAGANLHADVLSDANFAKANLSGAVLTDSDLAGSDLFGASILHAAWSGATCPDGSGADSHSESCASALAFRFAGFSTPSPGSTVAVAAKHVTVHFKLTTTSGTAIPASIATAIGTAKEVRAALAGPAIKATAVYCSWSSSAKEFGCTIPDPHGIEKGKTHSYTITVAEKPGSSFQTAPRLGKAANPETVHFG
jgi:uncharacterized protein YjbI with pentapeptide repeats